MTYEIIYMREAVHLWQNKYKSIENVSVTDNKHQANRTPA